jgi:predicted alpha/beta-fold hydrolase
MFQTSARFCTEKTMQYRAPWWLPGGHAQTIWSAKLAKTHHRGCAPTWQRERWDTPDGDFIDVDWLDHRVDGAAPLVIHFHGLEGGSDSHYAQALASMAQARGWAMVVVHFRGCSGEINRAPRAYHSGDHEEIDWILRRVAAQHPQRSRRAVGVSLGGNALMRWAGEHGSAAASVVDSVVSVCSPLDLKASGHAIGQGFNRWIYTPRFLKTMKPKAVQKWQQYPGLFNLEAALRANDLYAFDNVFTAPLHGFKHTDDYWTRAAAKPLMRHIALPALAINALNDPFVPRNSLPKSSEVSDTVTLWQPPQGGHVGFTRSTLGWGVPGDVHALPEAVAQWWRQVHG